MRAPAFFSEKYHALSPRDAFGLVLATLLLLLSIGTWQELFLSASETGRGVNALILWLFFLSAVFLLGVVVWKKYLYRILGASFTFLPVLLFFPRPYMALFAVIAITLSVIGMRMAEREMAERVTFHFFKSSAAGQFFFVLGLSLLISGAYFFVLKKSSWEELVPRFRLGEGGAAVFFQAASYFQPDLRDLVQREATVDEFLLDLERREAAGTASEPRRTSTDLVAFEFDLSLVPGIGEYLRQNGFSEQASPESAQELYLRSGREQLAALVGRPVSGNERISDIFSLAIQRKMIAFLSGGEASRQVPSEAVPFILSVLLFLTLLPLGGLLGIVCRTLGYSVFRLALKRRWLRLETVPGSKQVLE